MVMATSVRRPAYGLEPGLARILDLRRLRPAAALCVAAVLQSAPGPLHAAGEPDLLSDFMVGYSVFASPRCANCHAAGDAPTQSDGEVVHVMGVERGPDGRGLPGARCESCHAARAVDWPGAPPGAPGWHMPRAALPLVFAGRTPGELCRQLKDPARTGQRGLGEALEHMLTDPLVAWAFAPGPGREPPAVARDDFLVRLARWAKGGAPCPP